MTGLRNYAARIAIGFSCATISLDAASQDDFFADITTSAEEETPAASFSLRGYVQQRLKYGVDTPDTRFEFERDQSGLSMARTDFFLEIENKFSDNLNFRFGTELELETYRWKNGESSWTSHNERILIRDALLDVTLFDDHWLRVGHQIFSWGESEALAIIDVLSLRDLREFGQVELQDIREQIFALQYSLPLFSGKLNLVSSYKAGRNRYGEEDEEFYPYIILRGAGLTLQRTSVSDEFEFAAKYDYQFNGGDVSLVVADVNDNDLALELSETNPELLLQSQERVTVAGLSANRVWGSWLLKGELAQYFNQPVNVGLTHYRSDQTRGAIGIEYTGVVDWFFSYELNFINVENVPLQFDGDSTKPGHAIHIRHTSLHDRLQQDIWYFDFLDDEGTIIRWDINYEWSDTVTTGLSAVLYDVQNDESRFFPYRKHDSLNLFATFHF